jgi:hypothetical protein
MSMREYTDNQGVQRTAWTKVGVGFTCKNGSINVELDAIPKDFKIQLQVPLTKAEKDALFGQRQERQERQQNQQQPPPGQGQGDRRYAGQQQRASVQQRYGQRPASSPQPAHPQPSQDSGYEEYQGTQAQAWEIEGVIITDARNLPRDHRDYLPF